MVSLELSELDFDQVDVYDMQGLLLKSTDVTDVDISNFDNGVYKLQVKSETGVVQQRFIKE